jgi:hypothetical protein
MNTPPTTFPMLVLRFDLRSEGLIFPGFAGSHWHGGLGMMLQRQSPATFRLLYGGPEEVRLYALRPPQGDRFPPATRLSLQLTLFGAACTHALACTQAIAELGEVGLDPAGRYRLQQTSVVRGDGETVFYDAADGLLAPPSSADLRDWLGDAPGAALAPSQLKVHLLTPLRIKEGGELVRSAPSYAQLVHRLFGRLDQLAYVIGCEPPLAKSERAPLYAEAQQVALLAADLHDQCLSRRSARSRQQMSFGGLVGRLQFSGETARSLPWLRAGEHVQIGGKTAFGFGAYEIHSDGEMGGNFG